MADGVIARAREEPGSPPKLPPEPESVAAASRPGSREACPGQVHDRRDESEQTHGGRRGRVIGQNRTATGQGECSIAAGDDVAQHPVDAVTGRWWNEQAFFMADAVQVAVDRSIAEFVDYSTGRCRSCRGLLGCDSTASSPPGSRCGVGPYLNSGWNDRPKQCRISMFRHSIPNQRLVFARMCRLMPGLP